MNDNEKRRYLILLVTIIGLLIALTVYLTYFQLVNASVYKKSAQNKRNSLEQENIIRGSIYDRNGQVLAHTEKDENKNSVRIYSYPEIYSHIIGYSYKSLGKSGLELMMNDYLLNQNNLGLREAAKRYLNKESVGNSLTITIDTSIQKKASDLLGDRKGAIVAMNPQTGEIYAMVSKPQFNAQTLVENWDKINADKDSPLFNRAINGLYPPGSIFKVISTSAILESGIDLSYDHKAEQIIDGYKFKDATDTAYGKLSLEEAFTKSLNTYFAYKIQDVGKTKLQEVSKKFMFEEKIPFELNVSVSTLNFKDKVEKTQLASTAIGQGELLATPLQMALMVSAIANKGVMMEPYLVEKIESFDKTREETREPKILSEVLEEDKAELIKELMILATNEGTAKKAALKNIQVAGKTGTAQNAGESTHAWYVGFAPAENPVVAISIIIEQGGSGGKEAAPIAKEIFKEIFNNISMN